MLSLRQILLYPRGMKKIIRVWDLPIRLFHWLLAATVADMRSRLDGLNVPKLATPVTQEQIDELATKIEALKVLQAPQVTTAHLTALERRLEAKIAK